MTPLPVQWCTRAGTPIAAGSRHLRLLSPVGQRGGRARRGPCARAPKAHAQHPAAGTPTPVYTRRSAACASSSRAPAQLARHARLDRLMAADWARRDTPHALVAAGGPGLGFSPTSHRSGRVGRAAPGGRNHSRMLRGHARQAGGRANPIASNKNHLREWRREVAWRRRPTRWPGATGSRR